MITYRELFQFCMFIVAFDFLRLLGIMELEMGGMCYASAYNCFEL